MWVTASPLTWALAQRRFPLLRRLIAGSILLGAICVSSESHTHTCLCTGLAFRASPPPFPSQLQHPGPGMSSCHPALDKEQGRLPEEGSQLLPAPGWVEADVSNPLKGQKQMTSPPHRVHPPHRIPISPTERLRLEERRRRGGKRREGKRLELEVGYFGKKTKVLQNFTGQTSKR